MLLPRRAYEKPKSRAPPWTMPTWTSKRREGKGGRRASCLSSIASRAVLWPPLSVFTCQHVDQRSTVVVRVCADVQCCWRQALLSRLFLIFAPFLCGWQCFCESFCLWMCFAHSRKAQTHHTSMTFLTSMCWRRHATPESVLIRSE